MLTEVSVLPPEVSENLGLSGLLLVRATVSLQGWWDGRHLLSWPSRRSGAPVGFEVAVKLKAEVVKTSLLAAAGLTVIVGWGGWMLVKVPPLTFVCVVNW